MWTAGVGKKKREKENGSTEQKKELEESQRELIVAVEAVILRPDKTLKLDLLRNGNERERRRERARARVAVCVTCL